MSTLRNIKRYLQCVRQNNGILETDQLQLVARATAPSDANLTDGRFYIDSATDQAKVYVNSTWTNIGAGAAGGASDWDTLYAADKSMTVNSTVMTFAGSHASNDVFAITNASGSGSCLDLTQSGSGKDIDGTASAWSITAAGVITATGLTLGDDENITFGAVSDATIDWEGTNNVLNFAGACDFDDAITTQSTVTIAGSAGNDSLTLTAGDVELSDASVNITDADNATTLTVTNATLTTGGHMVVLTADAITDKSILYIDNGGASLTTGFFINCNDDGVSEFSVGDDGATVIAGNAAGTDALTITAGDIFLDDSDQNIIESENGTSTLLLLDNKAGAVGSGEAVLKVDAGGVVNAAGFGIHAQFTGAAAAGATVVGVVPDADSIGIFINGGGVDSYEALKVDADSTDHDIVLINSDGVLAADKGALQIVTTANIAAGGTAMRFDITGTPNADARILEFDLAAVTDTNEPYAIFVDAGGKHIRALHIDADPVVNDVAYIHSDAVIAADKALLNLHSAGAIADGANVFRITTAGTPDVASVAFEMDIQDDCQAFKLDTDATTHDAFYITHSGNLGAGKAVMHVTDAGDPGQDNSYVGHFAKTTAAAQETSILFADGGGLDVTGLLIDCDCVDAAANLSAQLTLFSDAAGDLPVLMQFYHEDAGAVDDEVQARMNFYGSNDGTPAKNLYAKIEVISTDTTTDSEDGSVVIYADLASTITASATFTGNKVALGAAAATLTTAGAWDLTISTNETAGNEPRIVMTDGAAGDITITAGGTSGEVVLASPLQRESNTGVTADVGSAQGNGAQTADVIEISTCANSGDAITLPGAEAGKVITVINRGVNSADVFPASSDNINEAGANAAKAVAADASCMFIGIDTTHWEAVTLAR